MRNSDLNQTSETEIFREDSQRLRDANHFYKNAPSQTLDQTLNTPLHPQVNILYKNKNAHITECRTSPDTLGSALSKVQGHCQSTPLRKNSVKTLFSLVTAIKSVKISSQ